MSISGFLEVLRLYPEYKETFGKEIIHDLTYNLRDDFEADSAKIASDPKTQEWWKITDALQIRMESSKPNEQWSMMDEVFHTD